jgi:DNA polymerase-1
MRRLTMRKVIYDIEANSLTPTRIWCVVAKDINTDEVFTFLEDDKDKFVKFCSGVQQFIGHNILQYDNYWINKLWGTNITVDQTLDTLVLSRLLNSCKEVRGKIELRRSKNQHSLQAWGDGQCADWYETEVTVVEEKLSPPFPDLEDALVYACKANKSDSMDASLPYNEWEDDDDLPNYYLEEHDNVMESWVVPFTVTRKEVRKVNRYAKIDFHEFDKYTPEMLTYCRQDVELNHRVYCELKKESKGFSSQSIRLEHALQDILCTQMRNGFKIDVPSATRLLAKCSTKCRELEQQMQKDFPPLAKLKKTYTPRLNTDGITHNTGSLGPMKEYYGFQYRGGEYSYLNWVPFNLSSPIQVVERLEGHWDPKEKTAKGAYKLSDKNIATIRDTAPDSIKQIKLYRMYSSRCNELKQWIEGAEQHEDNRLRGRIVHLGSWSGRASHSKPNTANISSVSMRKLNDGSGKKAPVLGEAGNFGWECRSLWTVDRGNVLVGCDASGIQLRILAHYLNNPTYTKAVLDDIHDFNAKTLGVSRDDAKTFIYSWLLGAGVVKTSEILNCSVGEAVKKREKFVNLTPGLGDFLKIKTLMADRGWYLGLDGRKVYLPSDHLALTAYLQNGEHVIMALSNIYWTKWAKQRDIPFKQCGYIHDEWQVETPTKYADTLGNLMKQSFRLAGEYLKLNCPLDGEYNVGRNWAETH